jgi:hypothetical protein
LSIPKARVSFPYVAFNTERGRLLATLGAWSTVALLIVGDVFIAVADGLADDSRISELDLLIFNMGGLLIAAWLSLLASSDKLDLMLSKLAKVTRESAEAEHRDLPEAAGQGSGPLFRILTNLWLPVTFQFLLVGWLVYASGGLGGSPFVSLLVTMMMIGLSVYDLPSIELSNPGLRALLVFVWRVLRFYAYPQLLSVFIMVALVPLQIYEPTHARPAPLAETMIATQLNLSIGMCVAYLARRFDQAGAASTDERP